MIEEALEAIEAGIADLEIALETEGLEEEEEEDEVEVLVDEDGNEYEVV